MGGMEWNGMTCLDSRRLCLPAEQPGFPNCSLVRGNTVHQTPGPEVQKWHPVKLYLPQLDGVQVQRCGAEDVTKYLSLDGLKLRHNIAGHEMK